MLSSKVGLGRLLACALLLLAAACSAGRSREPGPANDASTEYDARVVSPPAMDATVVDSNDAAAAPDGMAPDADGSVASDDAANDAGMEDASIDAASEDGGADAATVDASGSDAAVDASDDASGDACAGSACCGPELMDCAGTCYGSAVLDCMGVCGGAAELDCAGACDGSAELDCAGVCNGSAELDCGGVCNGSAERDCAGTCNGGAQRDCAGTCNGGAQRDCAGVCNGPASLEGTRCCAAGPCPAATCWDGYRNGAEGDVDCGGDCYASCDLGATCRQARDCAGLADCASGRCALDVSSELQIWRPHLTVSDMAHDKTTGTLYLSLQSGAPPYGDSVVAFEQGDTAPDWHVAAPSPGALAVSDDGSALYVGLGFERVARIDVASRTLGAPFTLGTHPQIGAMLALDLEAVPGQADTIGVIGGYWNSTGLAGLHMYRNGVELYPGETTDDWQSDYPTLDVSLVAFRDADTFYTYSTGSTTGSSAYELGIGHRTAQDLFIDRVQGDVIYGELSELLYADDRLFSSWGHVIDTNDLSVLGFVGIGSSIALSDDASRYYVTFDLDAIGDDGLAVLCYDTRSFLLTGGFLVPESWTGGADVGFNARLSRWGDAGLVIEVSNIVQSRIEGTVLFFPNALDRVPGCEPFATPLPQREPLTGPTYGGPSSAVRSFGLDARAVITDPDDGALYVTLGSSDPHYPNSVIRLEPDTGEVAWASFVGSEPRVMDIASGGPLWVGFDGSTMVSSVDPQSGEVLASFPIGLSERHGASYAIDIEAVPGHPETVVVVGDYPNTTARTSYFVYDDGVERYGLVDASPAQLLIANLDAGSFEVEDATRMYGTHGGDIAVVDVAPDGLDVSLVDLSLAAGPFWLADRRLVTSYGVVFDTESLAIVGDIELATTSSGEIALSQDGKTAYFVQAFTPIVGVGYRISCYDLDTLELKGVAEFNATNPSGGANGPIGQVARWGETGIAMLGQGGLMLVRDGLPELAGCSSP